MKNKYIITWAAIMGMIASITFPSYAYASDGEDYITISVDAVDDNADLKYALDSDDPTAFTKSNEFTVPAGTSHTIYVKDSAGNVTSQRYEPRGSSGYEYHYDLGDDDEEEQQINIDLELGKKETEEYSPDEEGDPGTASVTNRTKTDGSVDAEKVFYTFTTKEGDELYLVVDQGRGSDNVYLLDTVSLGDLRVLADGHESSSSMTSNNDEKEDNLLSILAAEESAGDDLAETETPKEKRSSSGNPLLVILIVGIGGGAYYYLKIYRAKKDEKMDEIDAMDMDEFEAEEDETDEVDFDYDEEEKQRYLNSVLFDDESEEGELLDTDPDEYATSHNEDEGDDSFDDEEDDFDDMF